MKQQFTGSYTLDVASRTITLLGIEIPQERLAVVINSSVGFVYHNLEHEPTGKVTIAGGNTTIVFPPYKDCKTHQNTDALSIFYDDGVDLGKLIKDESDETQALLQAEFDETQVAIGDFRTEVKAEFDETQALLQAEFDETQELIPTFQAEVKAESDETQALLQAEFDQTQTAIGDFRAEVKAESDATQALFQAEFDQTQTVIGDFRAEVKAESDETQALFQSEFDETQTAIGDFRTGVKTESDETQTLLNAKLPTPVDGMVPLEFLSEFAPDSDVDVSYVPGGYGPSQIVFSKGGVILKTLNLTYGTSGDALGKVISITPA